MAKIDWTVRRYQIRHGNGRYSRSMDSLDSMTADMDFTSMSEVNKFLECASKLRKGGVCHVGDYYHVKRVK